MRIALIPTLFVATLGIGSVVYADCPHSAQRDAAISLDGAQRVRITAGAGSLKVVGSPRATIVSAKGRACAPSRRLLEQTELRARRVGDAVMIEAEIPNVQFQFGMWSSPSLDFSVELPSNVPVEVLDGSGDIVVQNVWQLHLRDGSGDVEISNVRGDLDVTDGSGDLRIVGVGGEVTLTDGSGDVFIDRVGQVRIIADGSGDLVIRRVTQHVIIESDGSGLIDVDDVGGNFEVRSDGSGGIRYENVRGRVRLPRD
jgi:hypothetical protein